MIGAILVEMIMAIGRFFINPLLYVAILVAIFLGYRRVKRERKFFHIRILNGWTELKELLFVSVWLSLIVSVVSVVIGLTVPVQFLMWVSVLSIAVLVINIYHFLSPVLILTTAVLIMIGMKWQGWSFEVMGYTFTGFPYVEGFSVTVAVLAGILLIVEGLLIRREGARIASPILEKTRRGLPGIAYFGKRIWLLPVLFVVPGDAITAYFPWWPQFTLGSEQFSLVLFPLVIGFQQLVRKTLPMYLYPRLGRAVIIVGELVLLGGVVSYFEPMIGILVLLLGMTARLMISFVFKRMETNDVYSVIRSSNGAMIGVVLPDSPAEKMGLIAGEVIKRVNGREVFTERELYEALQINAAHCKLEVLDHNNEIRLMQHVVHSDDHHSIGLIIVH
ncbi:MAG: PDZ domain-containing protein [Solibacillus sp.]